MLLWVLIGMYLLMLGFFTLLFLWLMTALIEAL